MVDTSCPHHAELERCCEAGKVITCLIVDDNASYLQAATSRLEQDGLTVVGVASTSAEALQLARERQPDVILIDITLGDESGIELARRLVESGSSATLIMISTRDESDFPDLIAQTGASAFVAKHELSAALVRRLAGGPEET
jgi:DNA-binding NarL/FixJ family response regulator